MSTPPKAAVAARPIPPIEELAPGVDRGWNCVWCGKRLDVGAVVAGWSRGRSGAHVLDCEVWACPNNCQTEASA